VDHRRQRGGRVIAIRARRREQRGRPRQGTRLHGRTPWTDSGTRRRSSRFSRR
jgi:hypothetical protein